MISRTAFCSAQPDTMREARMGPMPGTSVRRSGAASMISKVSTPKAATIRFAMAGPMPRICPEARYFSMPSPGRRRGLEHLGLELQPVRAVADPDARSR